MWFFCVTLHHCMIQHWPSEAVYMNYNLVRSPWHTKEDGVSPGWTLAVTNTIRLVSSGYRLSGWVIVIRSRRLCCWKKMSEVSIPNTELGLGYWNLSGLVENKEYIELGNRCFWVSFNRYIWVSGKHEEFRTFKSCTVNTVVIMEHVFSGFAKL